MKRTLDKNLCLARSGTGDYQLWAFKCTHSGALTLFWPFGQESVELFEILYRHGQLACKQSISLIFLSARLLLRVRVEKARPHDSIRFPDNVLALSIEART